MAGTRSCTRLARRLGLYSSSRVIIIQITTVGAILFLAMRFVILHNHDDDNYNYNNVRLPPAARPTARVDEKGIDWSRLYYVQYVTSAEYLCNALMVWSQIERIGSRAQRMMLYPSHWDPNEVDEYDEALGLTPIARLLQQAQTEYYVKLRPVEVLHRNHSAQETWAESYTKLLSFNLTEFDRVLAIDSDSVVMQNLDELFLLPKAPVAMPLVYWGEGEGEPGGWAFSSQLMLVQPSAVEFSRIETAIQRAKPDEYGMDILNTLYKGRILHIPQRPFNLLSGELRRRDHRAYLRSGSSFSKWDADTVLSEAKFMHFSHWPVPKPWVRAPKDLLNRYMPACRRSEWFGASDCRDRALWLKLYYDFALTRKAVCGVGFELQSQELPEDSIYRHGKWFHPDDVR